LINRFQYLSETKNTSNWRVFGNLQQLNAGHPVRRLRQFLTKVSTYDILSVSQGVDRNVFGVKYLGLICTVYRLYKLTNTSILEQSRNTSIEIVPEGIIPS